MIWVFPVAPCSRFLFGFRVLVPVNSPTCGGENPLNSFTFPSTQHKKRSNDAFRITQHSGIFRPVHMGINCIFEVLCALRPWRRRESDSYTTASVPFRCVPPPPGTTAQPSPDTPFFVVLLPTSLRPLGCPSAQGRPPAVVEARPSPGSTSHTLRHPLHVLWPRAGSSPAAVLVLHVALSQYVVYASPSSSSSGAGWIPGGGNQLREGFHVRGAPYSHGRPGAHRNVHVVALWRPWFLLKR